MADLQQTPARIVKYNAAPSFNSRVAQDGEGVLA
jgi:hypothetical protein